MAWRTKNTSWTKKMKKKTKKLNELSLLQREKKKQSVGELEDWGWRSGLGVHGRSSTPPTHLKALYMGRYQQTKEQGVKRRSQSSDSPKPEPLLASTQNLARQARKFRRRARVLPEGQRGRGAG